jgi:hypothetical protein
MDIVTELIAASATSGIDQQRLPSQMDNRLRTIPRPQKLHKFQHWLKQQTFLQRDSINEIFTKLISP